MKEAIAISLLIFVAYFCIYALIDRICKCIEHCATARSMGKLANAGVKMQVNNDEETV